jgi:hypothetical protein
MPEEISQENLVKEFYIKNPNREIQHQEAVDWLTSEYTRRTGKIFRDPDRAIRKLSQSGFLIKIRKGVYLYDPQHIENRNLEDFTPSQREEIFKRDSYKCVVCGLGREHGLEIHVDHIKPKDLGGKAEISNGQTLCAIHNFRKKNYGQTETGKKMFIRLYEASKSIGDEKTMAFCQEVLEVYDQCNINGHIKWEK